MSSIVEFLTARLDEDEQVARATVWDGSGNMLSWELIASATIDVGGDEFYVGDRTVANHMMAWEPARVLAEVDAKRRMLALHYAELVEAKSPDGDDREGLWCWECDGEAFPCRTVRLLAVPYAAHPDYDQAWRL